MKILHYSDKAVNNFPELYEQCDILITTGDLSFFDFQYLNTIKERKPAFGVYGNHDSGNYLEKFKIVNLHNQVCEYDGLKLGGFQGCLRYKSGNNPQYEESEAERWANEFPYVDILLLHAGPKGMLDDPSDEVHIGSENVKRYVLEKKPKVVFVGHQYSDDFLQVGEIKIYRTYGARIIEI